MRDLCVVFDIDDTLYLERDYVRSGFSAVGPWAERWLGIVDFSERCREAFEKGTRGSIFNQAIQEARGEAPAPEAIAALVAIYRAHEPEIALLDDAREALTEASDRWPVAVISDGPAISQSRKAEALGLQAFASPIILTELYGRECSKPSPVTFRKVEEARLAKRYVYIADNPAKDFIAPQLLGWRSIRVRRPGGLHFGAENPGCRPDAERADCRGLIGLLEDLARG